MADTVGMQDIRGLNIDKAVTGFALLNYVFKERLCTIISSNSWQERYFKETAADLTGGSGNAIEGVPRLTAFPNVDVSWTQVNSYHKKHAAETTISREDELSNDVDTITRSLKRIGRAIAKSVDANIWNVITESQSPSTINSVTIAAGYEWNSATIGNRDPIKDILAAKQSIKEDYYDPQNAFLLLSPKDEANLLNNSNVRNSGQFYTSKATSDGELDRICGLQILVSPNVTADYSAVVIAKECASWKQLEALKVVTINNDGISKTIRAWEIGHAQLRNPQAVCLIINTQA